MALQEGELKYIDSNRAESALVDVPSDGELHVAFQATKVYSAWVEVRTSGGALLRTIPILGILPGDISPRIDVSSGNKVRVGASCSPAISNFRYSLYHVPAYVAPV